MTKQNQNQYSIWKNAQLHLLTDIQKPQIIQNGTIVTSQHKIIWMGETDQLPSNFSNPSNNLSNNLSNIEYDLEQAVVTPGLIDCHTHVIFGGNRANEFRQRLEGASYEDILAQGGGIYNTVKATRASSEAQLYQSAAQRVRQFLSNGVTSFEVKSGYGLNLESERKMLRVARQLGQIGLDVTTTFLGAHVRAPEFHDNKQYISYLIDVVLPELIKENLVDAVDAFCDKIAFSDVELKPLFEYAQQKKLKLKIHSDQLSTSGGTVLAAQHKSLSAEHLEYMTEQDAKAMQSAGMVAVLLPSAFYYLQQTQKPSIDLLRQYQIPIAIATDCNPGSSPCQSLLTTMNMGCVLFGLTPFEVLKGVTCHAAKALGWEKSKGQLAVGYDADFVVWDCEQIDELVYFLGHNPCKKVIKKGTVIYEQSA
jgi:imidazolonepropionase